MLIKKKKIRSINYRKTAIKDLFNIKYNIEEDQIFIDKELEFLGKLKESILNFSNFNFSKKYNILFSLFCYINNRNFKFSIEKVNEILAMLFKFYNNILILINNNNYERYEEFIIEFMLLLFENENNYMLLNNFYINNLIINKILKEDINHIEFVYLIISNKYFYKNNVGDTYFFYKNILNKLIVYYFNNKELFQDLEINWNITENLIELIIIILKCNEYITDKEEIYWFSINIHLIQINKKYYNYLFETIFRLKITTLNTDNIKIDQFFIKEAIMLNLSEVKEFFKIDKDQIKLIVKKFDIDKILLNLFDYSDSESIIIKDFIYYLEIIIHLKDLGFEIYSIFSYEFIYFNIQILDSNEHDENFVFIIFVLIIAINEINKDNIINVIKNSNILSIFNNIINTNNIKLENIIYYFIDFLFKIFSENNNDNFNLAENIFLNNNNFKIIKYKFDQFNNREDFENLKLFFEKLDINYN